VVGTQAPWGRWFVTVVDSLNANLNGSVSDGIAGIGGNLYFSSGKFTPMQRNDITAQDDRPLNAHLLDWAWENSVFRFRGATSPAQIHVRYWANGNPPQSVTTPLNVEGCFAYLTNRIAGFAAESKGWYQMADRMKLMAVGPKGEADASGGLLRSFLVTQVRGLQGNTYRRQPYASPGVDGLIYGSNFSPGQQ
jgi:hypothetical protein